MPRKTTNVIGYEPPHVLNLRVAGVGADNEMLYEADFMTFTQDAATCWPVLGQVLGGLETLGTRSDNPISMGRIARVEFIWDRGANRQGAVFFDDKGVPLIHAVNALLGYDGSGSMLSRRIMAKLGIDEAVFDEISALVRNQDYIVVLTREQHVEVNGLMRALPSMVVDTWDWHRHVPED